MRLMLVGVVVLIGAKRGQHGHELELCKSMVNILRKTWRSMLMSILGCLGVSVFLVTLGVLATWALSLHASRKDRWGGGEGTAVTAAQTEGGAWRWIVGGKAIWWRSDRGNGDDLTVGA